MTTVQHDLIVITGGPGAGKTTLIDMLRDNGLTTTPEAGRARRTYVRSGVGGRRYDGDLMSEPASTLWSPPTGAPTSVPSEPEGALRRFGTLGLGGLNPAQHEAALGLEMRWRETLQKLTPQSSREEFVAFQDLTTELDKLDPAGKDRRSRELERALQRFRK